MNAENITDSEKPQVSIAGIIGFALGLGGFLTGGLTAIPGFFFSIIGLYRKGHRIFAGFGLVISMMWLCLILQVLHSLSPPGLIPQPLQKLIYSPGGFWQDYDSSGLVETYFHGGPILGGSGWLYFKSDKPGTYTVDDAISFAEKNGWVYGGKTTLQTQNFSDYLEDGLHATLPDNWEERSDDWLFEFFGMYITYFHRIPFKIQRDCTIVAFEAPKPHYIIVSSDGKEMEVRIITQIFPDPAIPIPDEFKK